MHILLIILGSILAIAGGFIMIIASAATKNQANWDDFYNYWLENSSIADQYSEEMLYKILRGIYLGSIFGVIIGITCIILSILI